MKYIGPNISFIFTKIKELMNSHNTDNSAHSELFKSWKRLRNPNNADIADALAATYKNGIGDVLVEVKDDTTFALEDIKLFFRPASFKLISANDSLYEGIYITMDGTQGRYVAETFADSEIMTPEGPSTISTPSTLVLYPAASDAVTYTPQTLTDEQQTQARDNIGAGQPVFVVNVTSTVDNNYTADKTAAEIEAAYQAGRTIVCKTQMPISIGYIPVELPLVSRNQERAVFGFAVDLVQDNFIFAITVDISDSRVLVSNNMAEIYEKPASGIPKSDLEQSVQTSLDKADTAISYTPQTLTEEQQEQARTNIGALDVNVGTTPVDIDVTLFGRGENIVYVKDGWLRPCPTDADTELVKAYRRLAVQIGGQSTEPIPTAILATASGIYLLYQNGLTSANAKIMPTLLNENRYAIWTISTNNSKHYVSFSVYGVAYSHFCKYCVEDNALVEENFSRAIYSTSTGVGNQTKVSQFRMSANPTEDMHIATKQYVDIAKTEAQQLGLTTATPGKTIKVKTVQDGKPTEWEVANIYEKPTSGIPKTDLAADIQKTLTNANEITKTGVGLIRYIKMVDADTTGSGIVVPDNSDETYYTIKDYINSDYTVILLYKGVPYSLNYTKLVNNSISLYYFHAIVSSDPTSTVDTASEIKTVMAGNNLQFKVTTKPLYISATVSNNTLIIR